MWRRVAAQAAVDERISNDRSTKAAVGNDIYALLVKDLLLNKKKLIEAVGILEHEYFRQFSWSQELSERAIS